MSHEYLLDLCNNGKYLVRNILFMGSFMKTTYVEGFLKQYLFFIFFICEQNLL